MSGEATAPSNPTLRSAHSAACGGLEARPLTPSHLNQRASLVEEGALRPSRNLASRGWDSGSAAEGAGRRPQERAEVAGQVGLVVEAGRHRDVGDGQAGEQQRAGAVEAAADDVAV